MQVPPIGFTELYGLSTPELETLRLFDYRFPDPQQAYLSYPLMVKAYRRRPFQVNFVVTPHSNISYIPRQVAQVLNLLEYAKPETSESRAQTVGWHYVVLYLTYRRSVFEKFYIYDHTGDFRLGSHAAHAIGLANGVKATSGFSLPTSYAE